MQKVLKYKDTFSDTGKFVVPLIKNTSPTVWFPTGSIVINGAAGVAVRFGVRFVRLDPPTVVPLVNADIGEMEKIKSTMIIIRECNT